MLRAAEKVLLSFDICRIVKAHCPCYAVDGQKVGRGMKDYHFGNHIYALRMRLGLSQFQLGALVGVSDKAVSKWENGVAKPRITTCYRLAEVLETSISELLSCQQAFARSAGKECKAMNKKLWKQVYEKLSIYGENPPVNICLPRVRVLRCFATQRAENGLRSSWIFPESIWDLRMPGRSV